MAKIITKSSGLRGWSGSILSFKAANHRLRRSANEGGSNPFHSALSPVTGRIRRVLKPNYGGGSDLIRNSSRLAAGRMAVRAFSTLVVAMILLCVAPGAQAQRPLLADSFRLGQGGGVLCQVQTRGKDPAVATIFDRAWSIVCRDAARPVGKLYALRGTSAATSARLDQIRAGEAACSVQTSEQIDGLGTATSSQCMLNSAAVGYKVISVRRGKILWVAEGLAAYDSALKLGLRTVIADRIVPGKVDVATSSVDDPVAFARVQAGSLDPEQALAEGYRRNNSGNYAEAAEFFDTLQQQVTRGPNERERSGEYLINQALQKSNLGQFSEADAMFAQSDRMPVFDRIQVRLKRNFETLHLINQKRYDDALRRLDQVVAPLEKTTTLPGSAIEIGAQVAAEINNGLPIGQRLGATETSALSPEERGIFLDAQAMQLRGTLLRLKGQPVQARALFDQSMADILAVRDGRVLSVIRLRSQILAETGLALEDEGNASGAEGKLRESVTLLETRYPQSVAVNGARARLASLLARTGKSDAALAEYQIVAQSLAQAQSYTAGIGNVLSPYLGLLAERMDSNAGLANDMFLASQLLVPPGIADTQAVLARELSEGTSEGGRLFRQARNLERDIERGRIELANLIMSPNQSSDVIQAQAAIRQDMDLLSAEQAATQAKLADYPQFRAVSSRTMTLDDMKATLKPEEAFLKLTVAGPNVFALFVDTAGVKSYKVPLSVDQLSASVDALRETISSTNGEQTTTYAFDVALSRKLYLALLGPVSDRARAARHIIFNPDGAMMRLPLNLLVATQESADAYAARAKLPGADEFDFTGIEWLGRGRAISTTVSARAFQDARKLPASNATKQYLGLGQNDLLSAEARTALSQPKLESNGIDCSWPDVVWSRPISAKELRLAQSIIGADASTVLSVGNFSDKAIIARTDLADYRIVHFATHGFITGPRPECPARPSLLTSWGGEGSDGFLSFKEIFDLRLNADLIILSACDTAGSASVSATREAGVTSGGGNALDGLVRAFIGAGGRSVLASHWPVPDDFDATQRLILGLFKAPAGTSTGDALAQAQLGLMNDAQTSHPYYWSAFALVGDGSQALLGTRAP
jgi:CHAT domain-containing protein